MEVKVETQYCSEFIINETQLIKDDGLAEVLSQTVLKLQDEGIRKALIDLGWTPPTEEK